MGSQWWDRVQTDETPWWGVDLDGTLAYYRGNIDFIGEPIPAMMERVRGWVKEGRCVKIFTARASDPGQKKLVEEWLFKQGLDLEVTNIKTFSMVALYDDRAIQVERNTGRILECR